MQKKDHNQLWLGLQNDRFDQFWSVNRRLMENSKDKPFMNIPLRIYQQDVRGFVQILAKPTTDKNSTDLLTIGDFIRDLKLDPPPSVKDKDSVYPRLIVHGVEPPEETPLQWLSEHCSYPDNFLHFVVTWRQKEVSPPSPPDASPASGRTTPSPTEEEEKTVAQSEATAES